MNEKDVRDILDNRLPKSPLINCVVGWFKSGEVENHYHWKGDFSQTLPKNYIFEIGSITKTYTATLISLLVDEGVLSLNECVESYLDLDSKSTINKIKLLDLLTHHSGLPTLPSALLSKSDRLNPYVHIDREMFLSFISGYDQKVESGKKYRYSNFGYGILGQILEVATQKGYEQLLKEKILFPLGMESTWINQPTNHLLPVVKGTSSKGKKHVPYWTFDAMQSTGAILSNAKDQLTYARANLNADTFNKSVSRCHEPVCAINKNTSVGLAWMMNRNPKLGEIHFHNGGTGGFNSFLGIHPETKSAVVVLVNKSVSIIQALGIQEDTATKIGYDLLKELICKEN